MGHKQPLALAANENIGDLHDRLIEAVGKSGGHVRSASNPTHIAFDAHPNTAQSDAYPPDVGEKPDPAIANLVPSEQQVPAGINALDCVIMCPDGLHFGHVERFKCGVEPLIGGSNR